MKADFYIGLGENARWLGSIGDYGHPGQLAAEVDLFNINNINSEFEDYTEDTFVQLVEEIMDELPEHVIMSRASTGGTWPWDHNTSAQTRFTYAFNNGCIHVFEEGYMVAQHYPNGARKPSAFPSMVRHHPANPEAGA
jgi:hypothetical protein